MSEFQTILRARRFLRVAGVDSVPVDIECLADAANAKIKIVYDLSDDESGLTTQIKGKHVIFVNGNHRAERRRFTVLHEIAHIVLGLPSKHHGSTLKTEALLRYRKRPQEEVLCDVFAAECLLPHGPFGKQVADMDISLNAVKSLAEEYKASLTTTGSRFASEAKDSCAFVLSEDERIRYVSRSQRLRETKGWIKFNIPVPQGSVAQRLFHSQQSIENVDELPTDIWFEEGVRNQPVVMEEAILLKEWNQCLSLLWFDEDHSEESEPFLEDLDGTLGWPSRSRRR